MPTTLPDFGASGVDSLTQARTTGILEFRDGLNIEQVLKDEAGTVTIKKTITTAWGIAGQGMTGNTLGVTMASVTFHEEELTAKHEAYTGNTPGVDPPSGKLVGTDAFLILGLKQTMTVNYEGGPPVGYEPSKHGTRAYSLEVATALPSDGSFSVAIDDAIFSNPDRNVNITDWAKGKFELTHVIPQDDGVGTTHMIDLTAWGGLPEGVKATFYVIKKTINLTKEGWATVDISIEEHYGFDQADDWTA